MNTFLEQELVLGEPLHGLEKVRGERQLVTQLPLAAKQDRMVVSNLAQRTLGTLHVLTIPEKNKEF